MSVAIVDYGSGNLHSAAKAFERAARESGHDQPIVVTSDPDAVARADRVVLPGVGAFADCRRGLDAIPGMVEALEQSVRKKRPAVLRHLRRHAIDGRARPRISGDAGARLDRRRGRSHHAVRSGSENSAHGLEHAQRAQSRIRCSTDIPLGADGLHAYFVHSYRTQTGAADDLVAQADYGGPLTAIVGRDNMVGTQFHPEKKPEARACADREFFEVDAVILFPAIDLKDGLRRARSSRATWRARPCFIAIRRRRRAPSSSRASNICISSISTAPSPASR